MDHVELELHPFLKQLQLLVTRSEQGGLKLKEVMQHAEFAWAGFYVITDAGQMLFLSLIHI